jgi:hypothetical protein
MSALEMREFRRGRSHLGMLDFWDVVYFLIGLVVFGLAVCDWLWHWVLPNRFGVFPKFSIS